MLGLRAEGRPGGGGARSRRVRRPRAGETGSLALWLFAGAADGRRLGPTDWPGRRGSEQPGDGKGSAQFRP